MKELWRSPVPPGKRLDRVRAVRPPAGTVAQEGPVAVLDASTGAVVAVHAPGAVAATGSLGAALRRLHYDDANPATTSSQARLSGIRSAALTFGAMPPSPLRRRYGCQRCRFDVNQPELRARLDNVARLAWEVMAVHAPLAQQVTERRCAHLPEAWRLPDVPWTSGVINAQAALPYHRDSGNVPRSWSAMLGLRQHCEGGWLHLVDYDVWLAIPDGSLTLFDGQAITHGVSPFRLTQPKGYRFTVVWYARAGIAACSPNPADEAARAQNAASRRMLAGPTGT